MTLSKEYLLKQFVTDFRSAKLERMKLNELPVVAAIFSRIFKRVSLIAGS